MGTNSEDPDEKFNPWIVANLDEFLFFCCPECDTKSPTRAMFVNHALIAHPKVIFKYLAYQTYFKASFCQ